MPGWQIERPDRARHNRVVRVFAGPRWVRPDGATWTPIQDVVRVTETPVGVYVVSVAGAKIQLRPLNIPAAAIARSVIAPKHFGLVLKAADAPDYPEFEVKVLQGSVQRDGLLWKAATYDGVPLGMNLNDWARHKATYAAGKVTLDLRAAKAKGGEINLDPTVLANSQSGYLSAIAFTPWATTKADIELNGGMLSAQANNQIATYTDFVGGLYFISRGYLQFDTSEVGVVSSVTVNMKLKVKSGTDQFHMDCVADYGELAVADWDQASLRHVIDNYDVSGDAVDSWLQWSLQAADINTSGNSCFYARQYNDYSNIAPAGRSDAAFYGPDAVGSEPYLDITEGAAGGGGNPTWLYCSHARRRRRAWR